MLITTLIYSESFFLDCPGYSTALSKPAGAIPNQRDRIISQNSAKSRQRRPEEPMRMISSGWITWAGAIVNRPARH